MFDRPKPTVGCSANGRKKERINMINQQLHIYKCIQSHFVILHQYILFIFVKLIEN